MQVLKIVVWASTIKGCKVEKEVEIELLDGVVDEEMDALIEEVVQREIETIMESGYYIK